MPDWTGLDGSPTAARYQQMAEREVLGISPSYEAICLGVAGDAELIDLLDTLPAANRQPNLLLAAVRFLDGPVDSWPAFRGFVLDSWQRLAATMRERRTQTNEPGRCAALLPVLAALPQPLALLEVGAAAGLCLYPDRYAYRYGEHAVGASSVVLRCAVTGPVPLPSAVPDVAWRAGLDLHPLDVTSDADVRWLESLIWPEQRDRFTVLRGAVEIARAEPARIVAGDLTTDLASLAEQAPADATLVVFHSAVLAYVDDAGRAAFADAVRAVAAQRATCWLSNEAPGVVAGTRLDAGAPYRFVLARDGRPLALARPHGQSLDWLPPTA